MTAAERAAVPTVHAALLAASTAIGAIAKDDRNAAQGFRFRGIDAVVNACAPALRAHGITVTPTVEDVTRTTVEVGSNRTRMGHVEVRVRYRFTGPAGDTLEAVTVGEAMDAGDKATAKAMSVALRTALLQTLMLPTDEPDPDAVAYERSPATSPPANDPPHPAGPVGAPRNARGRLAPTPAQYATLAGLFATAGVKSKGDAVGLVSRILGREVTGSADLSRQEASTVITTLTRLHGTAHGPDRPADLEDQADEDVTR